MTKTIKIDQPLVSISWLYRNIDATNLLVLDATIKKVTAVTSKKPSEKKQLPRSQFFDLKNVFSDQSAIFPNTMLSSEIFEKEASKLGVQKESAIVVYDDVGMYSSARVWWLFKAMGFNNIAVLDGGFPAWESAMYPVENPKLKKNVSGNFKAIYQKGMFCDTDAVLAAISDERTQIIDARSKGRFYAKEPEPRVGLRGGHIPSSKSLPYIDLLENGLLKSKDKLKVLFKTINPKNKKMIFTCGSGITACILALGAEIAEYNNIAIYDGSWTEWGSRLELPIKK